MSIVGLFITTPLTMFDKLNTVSTDYTPYLKIYSIYLSGDDIFYSGFTGYTVTTKYSIYNNIDANQTSTNFKFTGLTSSLTFNVSVDDISADNENGQIIQDSYNIIMDYFDNNNIDYIIVGASHGMSEWYCVGSDTVTYSVIHSGTTIMDSLNTTMVSETSSPQRGTFSIVTGRKYYSTINPVNLVCEQSHFNIVPLSLNGYYFIHRASRSFPGTYYVYSSQGDAIVNLYIGDVTGINGTIDAIINIDNGDVGAFTGLTTGGNYFIESNIPVNITASQTGNDRDILSPSSKYNYSRRVQYYSTIYGGTPTVGSHVVYDDDLCSNTGIADGAGGDSEHGVGIEYISNTYSFGNTLSDFALIAPYSATTIDVSYYSGSWSLLESFTFNGTKISPGYAFRDGTVGVGSEGTNYAGNAANFASDANLWKFVGNYPFALVINDSVDAEMIVYGWMQNNEN